MGTVINFTRARHERHDTSEANASAPHPSDTLSFVRRIPKKEGGGIDSWSLEASGSYTEQCEKGRRLAVEFLSYIGQYPNVGNVYLLSDIVISIVEKARHGQECKGLYVGFFSLVGRYAMATAVGMHGELNE